MTAGLKSSNLYDENSLKDDQVTLARHESKLVKKLTVYQSD